MVEEQKAKLIERIEASKAKAVKKGELLSELKLSVKARVGEEGKLFGSVGTQDICSAIKQHSIEVEKKEVLLADGPPSYYRHTRRRDSLASRCDCYS